MVIKETCDTLVKVLHSTPEFRAFLTSFKHLHSNIQAENPFAIFFKGGFNAHSQLWWSNGDSTNEGIDIGNLFTSLGLTQVISELTNFEPNKNPSCIGLIITDQLNLILDCGTRASLDPFCHHQIIHSKVNFRIPPPPPFERNIWHSNRANTTAIKKSMANFPWVQHLNINTYPNWQVKTFNENLLNIMMNFVPNGTKRFVPRDPPWITKTLKTMLNRKNRLFKNYKSHGLRKRIKAGSMHSVSIVKKRSKMPSHPTYPLWETKLINLVLLKNLTGKLLPVL